MMKLAKMGTGLVMKGGIGLPLRLVVAAAMFWAAWLVGAPLGALAIAVPVIVGLVAITAGSDGRRDYSGRGYRAPWGLADFLRRAPFVCWCLMTDDGRDVPLWAILAWPFVTPAEVGVCICLLIALPFIGLGHVAAACGRAAWRVLSVRPLERRK